MKFPEKYRCKDPLGREHKAGDQYGAFFIKRLGCKDLFIIANSGNDWDHVSVSCRGSVPTWEDMCFVKSLFWDEDETVVQFHPRKSEYVNFANNCLHLWKFNDGDFPTPPSWMV